MQPLNPALYNALLNEFGRVKLSGAGERARVSRATASYSKRGSSLLVTGGEYYRVCCPDCNDTDFKLWVSYTFGTLDDISGQRITHTAFCYRCGDADRADLFDRLFPPFGRRQLPSVALDIGVASETQEPPRLELPQGEYVSLRYLPAAHTCRAYIEARGIDVNYVSDLGWVYCADSSLPMVARRIVIPLMYEYVDGVHCAGCQARAIPCLSVVDEPKYWTMTGTKKSRIVYNLHVAKANDVIVVTEGVTDAVRVGSRGVSLFGKSMSAYQSALLRRHCAGKTIVILLDSDAHSDAQTIIQSLGVSSAFLPQPFRRVVGVFLESGDPGSHSLDSLNARISAAVGE